MARIKLELPAHVDFETRIRLRIGDINYGGHLGNDAVLSLIHEARVQFLAHLGYTELNVEGHGIILADAAVVYRAEAFYGDELAIKLALDDFNRYGCDFFYGLTELKSGKEVAKAKTNVVFFDYAARRPVDIPAAFLSRLSQSRGETA
ncbi:4-hydroxybenzoyl-CoA thioesterase [Chitinivorax tropicus]|uniref:4-hydroxybenzoyl-CoA thioesterase n=1 Tax=Chitinivorax tropicus TaxID=714531 RepID=A0A840MUL3_9PROT|nr:thioesterase family protein [Chitinivorax tropicus]MBB5020013.1 4-hydroxybenzoyl-CoA thioesterase [Chitinivorax tropicus]